MGGYREILTENEAVKGYDFLIEAKVYKDGSQEVPTEATVTVKDQGGTKIAEDKEMTIDDEGTLTYTLEAAKVSDLFEDGVIEIEYTTDDDAKHKMVRLFDMVLNSLTCSVTDDDLKSYMPKIASFLWSGETCYDKQIEEAFRLIKRDIKDKGRRPHMLLDGEQIRELIIIKSFVLIFGAFFKERSDEDRWWVLYEEFKERYESRFSKLVIKYDEDEDGLIDSEETGKPIAQVTMVR
jgi:hypothetical protein